VKLLLDTHVWIWGLEHPERLSRRVLQQLRASANELYLSPVSIWEVHQLIRRGRLRMKQSAAEWMGTAFARMPLQEAPLTFSVAAEAARVQLPQSDIGDVFLAATASVYDLTLVTADAQLLACRWLKTLASD
jgi:PIN domain nuclease of toxin-antitoxin system